jgi:hypothetical protein
VGRGGGGVGVHIQSSQHLNQKTDEGMHGWTCATHRAFGARTQWTPRISSHPEWTGRRRCCCSHWAAVPRLCKRMATTPPAEHGRWWKWGTHKYDSPAETHSTAQRRRIFAMMQALCAYSHAYRDYTRVGSSVCCRNPHGGEENQERCHNDHGDSSKMQLWGARAAHSPLRGCVMSVAHRFRSLASG